MTIQLELDPETEAKLNAEAKRRGLGVHELALKVVSDFSKQIAGGSGVFTLASLEAFKERISANTEHLPTLPPEANNREFYYEDR